MPKRTTYEEFSKKFYNSLAADENYTLLSNTYTNNRTKSKGTPWRLWTRILCYTG